MAEQHINLVPLQSEDPEFRGETSKSRNMVQSVQ